jgi:hypothetical protein
MAYPGQHVLVAWGGKAPGGEIWNNTLRMYPTALAGGYPTHEVIAGWLAGGFKDALATFWGVTDNFTGIGTTLEWMKANNVGTDGKYTDDTTNLYTWATPLGALNTTPPNQNTLVVSLTTGIARGRAHIGRFYLPSVVFGLDATTGQISSANATTIANGAAAFISAMNNATDLLTVDQMRVSVVSNLGAGTHHEVTGVRVGRIVDTQRRRRNKQTEAYISVSVP